MRTKNQRRNLWLSTAVGLVATIVACSGNDSDPDQPQAGAAGQWSRGGSGSGDRAGAGGDVAPGGAGGAGRDGGQGGVGDAGQDGVGTSGAGGTASCGTAPYQVLEVLEQRVASIIAWPDHHRVAVLGAAAAGVLVYEIGPDEVTQLETITPEDLDLADDESISEVAAYGDGMVVLVEKPGADEWDIVVWHNATGPERILTVPEPGHARNLIASPRSLAVAAGDAVLVANRDGDVWSWEDPIADPGRSLTPLALADAGMVLVGVNENLAGDQDEAVDVSGLGGAAGNASEGGGGMGGAAGGADRGGAGGGASTVRSARVELWMNGRRLEQHPAIGNPARAIELDVGEGNYLIAETNSFWGSYRAALEVYGESGTFRPLVEVPVYSSTDGTDGAFDVALRGEELFIANCESGLLTGTWAGAEQATPGAVVTLSPLEGPWTFGEFTCSPTEVEVVDDVLVVGGQNVVFARLCE